MALFLALQMCGIPLTAYAQTTPGGRQPANTPGTSGDEADEEEEEEEEESAPRSNAGGEQPSGEERETEPAPEAPARPATPETDDERRTRLLPRFSTLDGSVGLLHTAAAEGGGAGSFRFGIIGEYFGASDFLRPLDSTFMPGTTAVGGQDDASHIGGTLTLSYSPFDFLEVYGSIRAYANSNNRERPQLFQVLGDTNLGVKGFYPITRGFSIGGDAAVYLLNRSGDIGLLGDSTSFHLRLLSTLDLKEMTGTVPLRFHLNLRYYFDNSSAIVEDTENRRQMALPGYTPDLCTNPATANLPECHLEVSRVERFALGINRVDRFGINIGVDAPLPYVRPFLEWSVGIPVNRQSYQCFDPGTSPSTGMRNPGPGGASDDDLCLANTGFSSLPSRLTLGARVLPPVRGLSAMLAFDIATSGTTDFVREVSPTPPWMFYFGAAFAYDTHPQVQRVTVPGPERVVDREVDRTPPGGTVLGQVRDADAHTAVPNAIVTFTGHPELPIVATGADGNFRTGRLPPGEYRLNVVAPDYNAGQCSVTVAAPAATEAPAAGGATPAPAGGGAGQASESTVTCELRALPRRGGLTVRVVSSQGGAPVPNATVVATPAPGMAVAPGQQAPTELQATTDAGGSATFNEMLAGQWQVRVNASDRHMAAQGQDVAVEPRQTGTVNVTVTRRPARPSVFIRGNLLAITRQVHFQTNTAEILPDSQTLLEEIADVLQRHPEIVTVEIQGHTDNQGTATRNEELSQQRAESVRSALLRLGVAADRMSAVGFGPRRPVQTNLTAAGRAANRRVEFHIRREGGAGGGATRPAPRTNP